MPVLFSDLCMENTIDDDPEMVVIHRKVILIPSYEAALAACNIDVIGEGESLVSPAPACRGQSPADTRASAGWGKSPYPTDSTGGTHGSR